MSAPNSLAGKVAVVTGAASGMGRSCAVALAACGVSVVCADIADEGGSLTAQDVIGAGGTATAVQTDVADDDAVRDLIATAVATYGRLDLAVNAAAIEIETDFLAATEVEVFDRVIAVNLRSVFLCMKYEIAAMLACGGGSIVNFASTNAFKPQQTQSAYNASKFGVVGLTRTAALEYTRRGIRVNAVAPGAIDTPMLRDAIAQRGSDEDVLRKRFGLFGRFGEPGEVAAAVRWLCSDESSFTSGHTLAVDGGMLAG